MSFQEKILEDEKEKLGKNKDEVSNWKLIDEIRIEQDKPTIAETLSELYGVNEEDFKMAGAVILNPIFQQNLQMLQNSIQSNSNIDEDPNSEYEDNEFEENEEETQTDLVF